MEYENHIITPNLLTIRSNIYFDRILMCMKMPKVPPTLNEVLQDERLSLKDMATEENMRLAVDLNSKYLHWDDVRRRDTGDTDPKVIWALMSILRQNNQTNMNIGGISTRFSLTADLQRSMHEIDVRSSSGFAAKDISDPKAAKAYAVSSLMEESIASSQIEGAVTTTRMAKTMLREGRMPKTESEKMIYNNYRAMQFIKENKEKKLTPDMILELHTIITKGTLDDEKYEGRFRETDDIVVQDKLTGDVFHEPPKAKDLKRMMSSLCSYANSGEPFVHPVIKGIVIHFMTAYIHPFVDGNGRLARSLLYWYVLKEGYWIFEYLAVSRIIKEHRGDYDRAYVLSETDGNDITYFIKYNLDCIEKALEAFIGYLEKKISERKESDMSIHGNPDLNIRQKMILKDATRTGEPFSTQEVRSTYQVSYQTAANDIRKLLEMRLIKEHGKVWRKVLYIIADRSKEPIKGGSGSRPDPKHVKGLDKWADHEP